MDKGSKKHQNPDKKADKIVDRGDLKKTTKIVTEDNTKIKKKIPYADRGDANSKLINKRTGKFKINVSERQRTDEAIQNDSAPSKVKIKVDKTQTSTVDIRKLIRDRYTLRKGNETSQVQVATNAVKNPSKDIVKSDRTVNRSRKQLTEEITQPKEKPKEITDITSKKTVKEPTHTRKPIIKTITSKNAPTRVFKAVTFGERRSQLKPLQINIPNGASQKQSKSTDTITIKPKTVSRATVKEKPEIKRKILRKRMKKRKLEISPDSFKFKEDLSPPTEVAKWAPSCVNRHTKPYYEAWVNTTLAAISKGSGKDKFLQKQSILQSFQRAMEEGTESPELIYEKLKDEKYTGRIRVRHR